MSRLIGIAGASGSGKTAALRNMPQESFFVILPNDKVQFTFPGSKKKFSRYDKKTKKGNLISTREILHISDILQEINKLEHVKYVVIEDFTHFFNARTQSEEFRNKTSGNSAFKKWSDLAADTFNGLFRSVDLREDLTIAIHFHIEKEESIDGFKYKIKTPGNLLERDIDIPSYFTYMLYTKVLPLSKDTNTSDRYKYITNDDGSYPAKTPYGCFEELYIGNDLYNVIKRIEEYENL